MADRTSHHRKELRLQQLLLKLPSSLNATRWKGGSRSWAGVLGRCTGLLSLVYITCRLPRQHSPVTTPGQQSLANVSDHEQHPWAEVRGQILRPGHQRIVQQQYSLPRPVSLAYDAGQRPWPA